MLTREPQRLVVVAPLVPLTRGVSFPVAEWPLHVTVLPPFLTRSTPEQVALVIAEVVASQTALTARAGADALFGRKHDVPVTLVHEQAGLTRLHDRLVEALRPLAARPEEPAFTGAEFRAHITVKGDSRVAEGDRITLTQLALVDMTPRADAAGRTVLATVALLPQP